MQDLRFKFFDAIYNWAKAPSFWGWLYPDEKLIDIYNKNMLWYFENPRKIGCKDGWCEMYNDKRDGSGKWNYGPGLSEDIWENYGLRAGEIYSEEYLNEIARMESLKLLNLIHEEYGDDDYFKFDPKQKLILLDLKYLTGNNMKEKWPALTEIFLTRSPYVYGNQPFYEKRYPTYDDAVKNEFKTYWEGKEVVRRNKAREQLWDWDENDLENFKLKGL